MDLRTGKTYESYEAARAAGVPDVDIAIVERRLRDGMPVVKFSKGSFKTFVRNDAGELVRKE